MWVYNVHVVRLFHDEVYQVIHVFIDCTSLTRYLICMLDSLVKEVFLSTSRWQLLVLSLSQPQSQFANKRCSS